MAPPSLCVCLVALLACVISPRATTGKELYTESALDFLLHYGQHYNLFSRFFANTTYSPPAGSRTAPITDTYATRDWARFRDWESTGTLRNFTEGFYRQDVPPLLEEFNNQFRYGTAPTDRFLSVFLHDATSTLYFFGFENNLHAGSDAAALTCRFLSPLPGSSSVAVEGGFKNAIKQTVQHSQVTCPLPPDVAAAAAANASVEIVVQLVRAGGATSPTNPTATASAVTSSAPLLPSVTVRREHPLDRRPFNITLSTQVDDWNEPLLIEWLTYHILLGVEHFYLFDITRTDWAVRGSAVEPFLHANLVTLIHFPFVPLKNDDHPFPATYAHASHGVHCVTLNIGVHRFGPYSTFIGFHDLDEFFVPSADMQPTPAPAPSSSSSSSSSAASSSAAAVAAGRWGRQSPLLTAFARLGALAPQVPGIMFDTLEMGCADADNYHHSPSPRRPALSATCTISGCVGLCLLLLVAAPPYPILSFSLPTFSVSLTPFLLTYILIYPQHPI